MKLVALAALLVPLQSESCETSAPTLAAQTRQQSSVLSCPIVEGSNLDGLVVNISDSDATDRHGATLVRMRLAEVESGTRSTQKVLLLTDGFDVSETARRCGELLAERVRKGNISVLKEGFHSNRFEFAQTKLRPERVISALSRGSAMLALTKAGPKEKHRLLDLGFLITTPAQLHDLPDPKPVLVIIADDADRAVFRRAQESFVLDGDIDSLISATKIARAPQPTSFSRPCYYPN